MLRPAAVSCLLLTSACGTPASAPVPILAPAPAATSIAVSPPTAPPPEWPESFPALPGGVPQPAPEMGPVHMALIAYPDRDVEATDRAQREALTAAGWTLTDARPADTEAHRFVAERQGQSVSVSIYRDGTHTIVQTMQL